jgi:hypothetical protein
LLFYSNDFYALVLRVILIVFEILTRACFFQIARETILLLIQNLLITIFRIILVVGGNETRKPTTGKSNCSQSIPLRRKGPQGVRRWINKLCGHINKYLCNQRGRLFYRAESRPRWLVLVSVVCKIVHCFLTGAWLNVSPYCTIIQLQYLLK